MDISVFNSAQLPHPSLSAYFALRASQCAAFYGQTPYTEKPEIEDQRPETNFYIAHQDHEVLGGARVIYQDTDRSARLPFERHAGCTFEELTDGVNRDSFSYCEVGGLAGSPKIEHARLRLGEKLLRRIFCDLQAQKPAIDIAFASVRSGSAAVGLRLARTMGLQGIIRQPPDDPRESPPVKRFIALISLHSAPILPQQNHSNARGLEVLGIADAKSLRVPEQVL